MSKGNPTRVWISGARQGDALALSKLLATYHPILRSHADAHLDGRLRSMLEPEDLLQQTYLEVFRSIDQFEDRGPNAFVNWVLTILDHKLIDLRRAMGRQKRDVGREQPIEGGGNTHSYWNLLDQLYADSRTPSRIIRREEAVGALITSMSRLTESHRQLIQLRFLEGHSVAEVARMMDRSEDAIVALTRRALDAVRRNMDAMGEFTRG